MKIDKQAKIDVYYLILFWSTQETIKNNVYFIDKEILFTIGIKNRFLIVKKQKQNKKVKKQSMKLLQKIQELSVDMKKLSHEMLVYISLNWLINEANEKYIKSYKMIPIVDILEEIRAKYKDELKEHYKFFEKIEEEL